jgi:hypothetical protein
MMGLLGKGVEKSQERFCRRCIAVITAEQVITIGKFLGEMQPEIRFRPQGKTVRGYSPHAASVLQPFVNCKDFDDEGATLPGRAEMPCLSASS